MQTPENPKTMPTEFRPKPAAEENSVKVFGTAMREARERAGYTIERVALASRISLNIIKALEEMRPEQLPGQAFVRGFVRNLCKLYQLDPTEMLQLADEALTGHAFDAKLQPLKKDDPKWDLTHEQKPRRSKRIRRAGALFIARHFQLVPLVSFVVVLGVVLSGFFYLIKLLAGIPEGSFWARNVRQAISEDLSPSTKKSFLPARKNPGVINRMAVPAAKIAEPLPSSVIFFSGISPQHLEIKANEAARVEMQKDDDGLVGLQLSPSNHVVTFSDHADLLIRDAAAVQLSLDGRNLDPKVGGGKGMRISFKKIPQIKQKKSKF